MSRKKPMATEQESKIDREVTFIIPVGPMITAQQSPRDLTEEEWEELKEYGLFKTGYMGPSMAIEGMSRALSLVVLQLVRSGHTKLEISELLECMSRAGAALRLAPEAREARFPVWGLDPKVDHNEITEIRRGYWLLLLERLLELGMEEEEARSWAEIWRPMLELPPHPDTIHAREVLDQVLEQKTLRQARSRVKCALYPFQQFGGALPLNPELLVYPK